MVPALLRLSGNRKGVLTNALNSKGAYKKEADLFRLVVGLSSVDTIQLNVSDQGELLGISETHEIKLMVAEAAFREGDVQMSAKLCRQIAVANNADVWKVAFRLYEYHFLNFPNTQLALAIGKKVENDNQIRREMLGIAALHCPPEHSISTMASWRDAEVS